MKYYNQIISSFFATVLIALSLGGFAQSTFTVTLTSDSGPGSLRQAIIDANANGDGGDIINFSSNLSGTIFLSNNLPTITSALTINGPGEEVLAISGQNTRRIFFIKSTGSVIISDITLKEGRARGGNGGSTWNGGGAGAGMGGAIFLESGTLNLSFVTLANNSAIGGNGGATNANGSKNATGGAGPFGGTSVPFSVDQGTNGGFGAGGASGQLNFSGEPASNGGAGGYGAGGGSAGHLGGGAPQGVGGVGGTFGGNGGNGHSGSVGGGGGAGLGAALFIYGGSATLNTVSFLNNSTSAGSPGSSSAGNATGGQAKAAGIFHYSGSLTNLGLIFNGNSAAQAGSTNTDNADFFSQQSLSLMESNPPVISRNEPQDGELLFQKGDEISLTMNENIYNTDGSAISISDLQNIITFKETDANGADVTFTATLDFNKMEITPSNELINGQQYYLAVSGVEDRNGNEMSAPAAITFTVDGDAPLFTANPVSGTVLTGNSFTFTSDEPIYNLDGSEIEAADFVNIVVARLDNAAGDIVSTSVFRTGNDLKVTFDEALPDQLYYVELKDVADLNGNAVVSQTFTYSRPSFAQANMTLNVNGDVPFAGRLIEVEFDEDYFVENSTGVFSAFNNIFASGAMLVVTVKEDDANGADVEFDVNFRRINGGLFDYSTLHILPSLQRNQQYYLKISNLYNADNVPLEPVEVTFSTPDRFNPILGSGYGRSFVYVSPTGLNPLGSEFTAEFFVKHENGYTSPSEPLSNGSSNTDQVMFWLNSGKLTVSKHNGSVVTSGQQIESNTLTGFDTDFQHLAISYSSGMVTLYHNGLEVGSGAMNLDDFGAGVFGWWNSSISGDFGSVSFNSGNLIFDEVRLWDTELSQTDIANWSAQNIDESHPNFANLQNLWHFDEGDGDMGIDGVTRELNLCFDCAGQYGGFVESNRFAEPIIQLSVDGEVVAAEDEIVFTAGNGGQLIRTFEITNIGDATLQLTGDPGVTDFPARFALDFSEGITTLEPNESTSFTMTFQSSDVRTYQSILKLPNNSLNHNYELNLTGRGISITNGLWETVGEVEEFPVLQNIWANDGKLYAMYLDGTYKIAEVGQSNGAVFVNDVSSVINFAPTHGFTRDGAGNFYGLTYKDYGNSEAVQVGKADGSSVTIPLHGYTNIGFDFSGGQIAIDQNGTPYVAHSYSDGDLDHQHGIKIQQYDGYSSTLHATLTFEDVTNLHTVGNAIYGRITAYDFAFNSNNELYVSVLAGNEGFFILKYDDVNGWDNLGYHFRSDPDASRTMREFVELKIDAVDNLHVGSMNYSSWRYHKFSPTGDILKSGEYEGNTFNEFGFNNYGGDGQTVFQHYYYFGVGAGQEPVFVFRDHLGSGIVSVVLEAGNFRLFNERFITGETAPLTAQGFKVSFDEVTGQPYIINSNGSAGTMWTTKSLAPSLSVSFDGSPVKRAYFKAIRTGVGTSKSHVITLTNDGLTDLDFAQEDPFMIAGDNVDALSYDLSEMPSSLTIGESFDIEISFDPKQVFTSSATIQINSTDELGAFTLNLALESLDDVNTGDWEVYANLDNPVYTSAGMTIGNHGLPVYTYNTYETIAGTGANAGQTIPYVQLHANDPLIGQIDKSPDDLASDMSLPANPTLTTNYQRIQQVENPFSDLSYFTMYSTDDNENTVSYFNVSSTGLNRAQNIHDNYQSDVEISDDGFLYRMIHGPIENRLYILPEGLSQNLIFDFPYTESDMDLELGSDHLYFTHQSNADLLVAKRPLTAIHSDPIDHIFSTIVNAYSGEPSHTKDIELYGDVLYLAYISANDQVLVRKYENDSWTDLAALATDEVVDLQLQIGPDGTPYVSIVEWSDILQSYNVSVIRYEGNTASYVGEQRFATGVFQQGVNGLENAPTQPALRAPFQIDDHGTLYLMFGDQIFTYTETPAVFNHLPVFTSAADVMVDEDVELNFSITVTDEDASDQLTITTSTLPDWVTFSDEGNGLATLTGTPSDADADQYEITITVFDGGEYVNQEFLLTAVDLNTTPSFDEPVATITMDQDAGVEVLNLAGITDGDEFLEQDLSFEVVSDNVDLITNPSASVIDETGLLIFQPNPGESGIANLTITLADDGSPVKSISYSIEVTVNTVIDPNAIVVSNLDDSGAGSLRAAIIEANADPGHDVIDMRNINGTISLTSTLPILETDIDIIGASGSLVTVDGGNSHQVLFMDGGNVTLKEFAIINGSNVGGNGAIGDGGGGGGAGFGGAIFLNGGNLIIDRMSFTGNVVQGGAGSNSSGVTGGAGGSSLFGNGGTGGASNFGQPGGVGGNGPNYGSGGGGGGQGTSGFAGGKGGNGNFGGGAGGGGGSSSSSGGGSGSAGQFGGVGGVAKLGGGGGGGAGLGGAIFARSGNIIVNKSTFTSNNASGGARGSNSGTNQTSQSSNGQGKGGAIFIGSNVGYSMNGNTFSGNAAENDLGITGDNNDVYIGSSNSSPVTFLSPTSIDENVSSPTEVGELTSFTGDQSEIFFYSIDPNVGDASDFSIDGDKLVFIGSSPDFESKSSYQVNIISTSTISVNQTLMTISVNDLDDPATSFSLDNTNMNEGQPVGSVVGSFDVTDVDGGVQNFLLTDGYGDNSNFQIVGNELQVSEILDYDDQSTFSIQVELGNLTNQYSVTINNINVTPSGITLSNSTIPENSFGDYLIGTLDGVDTDDEDTHIFQFVSTNSFETSDFKIVGDELRTNRNFDFETESTVDVEIKALDNNNEQVIKTLTISLTDANDGISGINISSSEIEEGQSAGTEIGLLSAIDQDAGDTHTFTLVSGFGENYACNIVGNSLQTVFELNFDFLPTLNLKINVNDGNGGVNEFEFTVNVTDVNRAPSDILITSTSMDENSVSGTVIGSLSSTDQDSPDEHTYSLADGFGDNSDFEISGSALVTSSSLDFETKSTYSIKIRTDDGNGGLLDKEFGLTVNDLNETPSAIALSENSISENVDGGTTIGALTTTDEDSGGSHSYTLVDFGDHADFEIVGSDLIINSVPDFEEKDSYSIKISTKDSNNATYEQELTISVSNENEAPTAITVSNLTISEADPVGTVVGSLSTTDPDEGDEHSYEVLTSVDIDGTPFFPFIVVDGSLVTNATYDFDSGLTDWEIEIKTTDTDGLSHVEKITIIITDSGEAPTDIVLAETSIDENLPIGSVIGGMISVDQDAGDNHTYTLVADFGDNSDFEIAGSDLTSAIIFDFESKPSYAIKVSAKDESGFSVEKEFEISIVDVNDNPTDISLSGNSITENNEIGTVIGTLSTSDQDAGETHTYSLISEFGDAASFSIIDGELMSAVAFDFETKSSYSLKIKVEDADGGSFEKEFIVEILDANEGESQTITFEELQAKTFGDEPFDLTATSSSELEVTFSSSDESVATVSGITVTIVGAGETMITASQTGDEIHGAAPDVTRVLVVDKADQEITFGELENLVFGEGTVTISATSTSELEVSFTVEGEASLEGGILTPISPGEVTVTASQPGNSNYKAANDVIRTFVVLDPSKTDQTITFNPPAVVYIHETPIILEASSDSNLDLEFEIVSGEEHASISGDNLHLVSVGTIQVEVRQAGNDQFNPASEVRTIEIKPVFSISGSITDENGSAFSAGTVAIFEAGQTTGIGAILNTDGSYQFENVKGATYFMVVFPDDQDAYHYTAYGNTIFLPDATAIELVSDLSGINISMVAKEDNSSELDGVGVVTGRVINDDGSGARVTMGRILDGEAVEGASIFLIRKSDDKILTEVYSDANGDFEIRGIPEGTFEILINIPGVEGTVSTEVNIVADQETLMTAMVGEEGIVFDQEVKEILSTEEDQSLSVYPNPISNSFTISLSNDYRGVILCRISNLSGQVLYEEHLTKNSDQFERKQNMDVIPGIYLLELRFGEKVIVKRLLKN